MRPPQRSIFLSINLSTDILKCSFLSVSSTGIDDDTDDEDFGLVDDDDHGYVGNDENDDWGIWTIDCQLEKL